MKNLRITIRDWLDKRDGQWQALSVKKQQCYTLLLFASYTLLTLIAMVKVHYDLGNPGYKMTIAPIENPMTQQKKPPVSPQDSISTHLKHKTHGR